MDGRPGHGCRRRTGAAVRECGARLEHALDEFEAQQQAERRGSLTGAVVGLTSAVPQTGGLAKVPAVGAVAFDLDGTWDATPDTGPHSPLEGVAGAAGGDPRAAVAYERVADLLGTPTAPESPESDRLGLIADVTPGPGSGCDEGRGDRRPRRHRGPGGASSPIWMTNR
ncbi:hypothetical protein [Candidatus Blastococcus massiliensis]|uniref:hypothetical protein n=1 Tax=Candidatus Blastococcus massiliensis TaxID=1470358 RepID=UPI0004B405D9|nr:hypothetical protein [Candidatus Blastococcus massiliensis]